MCSRRDCLEYYAASLPPLPVTSGSGPGAFGLHATASRSASSRASVPELPTCRLLLEAAPALASQCDDIHAGRLTPLRALKLEGHHERAGVRMGIFQVPTASARPASALPGTADPKISLTGSVSTGVGMSDAAATLRT